MQQPHCIYNFFRNMAEITLLFGGIYDTIHTSSVCELAEEKAMKEKNYKGKIFLCVFAFVALFFCVVSIYVFRQQKDAGERSMQNVNQSVISSIENEFSLINDTVIKMLSDIKNMSFTARIIYQGDYDANKYSADYKQLNNTLVLFPHINSAVTYNNKTKSFQKYIDDGGNFSVIQNNIIYNGKSTAPFVPYISSADKNGETKWVVTYYAYDYLEENIMNGAIAVNIDMDWLDAAVKCIDAEDINVILYDNDGRVCYSYDRKAGRQNVGKEYIDRADKEHFNTKINGKRYYVSTGKLPASDYTIVCELAYDAKTTGASALNTVLIMLLLLLALGVFALVWSNVLAKYMLTPFKELLPQADGGVDDASERDVFDYISGILDKNAKNTVQITEMKKAIDDVKMQENIKAILHGRASSLPKKELEDVASVFGGKRIRGAELIFDTVSDMEKMKHMCDEALGKEVRYSFVMMEYNRVILLFIDADAAAVSKFAEDMSAAVRNVSVFISEEYDFADLPELYTEIRQIAGYELTYGKGCVLTSEIIRGSTGIQDKAEYPKTEENKLKQALESGKAEDIERAFDDFLGKIIMHDAKAVHVALVRVAFAVQSLYENRMERDEKVHERIVQIVNRIDEVETMDNVYDSFRELFELCSIDETASPYSKPIAQTLKYIDDEFSNINLNLDMIADKLNLSPNYLGKMFKKEVGDSVGKYIVEYRLKKAVVYMNETDMRMKTIIDKVGFVSESNFYKQFKNYYGVTPSEYRQLK